MMLMTKIKNEIAKFSSMSKNSKISYFKTYYLMPVIIAVFLLGCLIWMFSDFYFNRIKVVYSGAIFGCDITDEGRLFLTDGLLNCLTGNKPDPREQAVLSEDMHMLFAEGDEYNGQGTNSAIYTMFATGEFNYLILDGDLTDQYLGMDACYDLTEIIDETGLAKEDGYFVNNEIVALRMSDEAKERCGINSHSGKDIYLAFVNVGGYREKDILFVKYIYGMKL